MSHYQLGPPPPPRDRTRSLIVGIALVLLFLVVIASLFFLSRTELAMAPTSTPTATFALVGTATPDFGATRVAQDFEAQQAGPLAIEAQMTRRASDAADPAQAANVQEVVVVTVTVVVVVTAPPTPVAVSVIPSPAIPTPVAGSPLDSPLDTPLDSPATSNAMPTTISLPLAVSGAQPAAPTSILPTPAASTIVQTALPTAPASPTVPVPTPVPITPSPTSPPVPSPLPYRVDHLLAKVERADIDRRRAPVSGLDTESDQTWNLENEIRLSGRSLSGEWVYGEQDGEWGWLRQVHIRFLDNELPGNAPEDLNPNDVRWLLFRPWPNDVEPLPPPTAIPPNDYPLARRDRANQSWIKQPLPSTLGPTWPNGYYEAGDSFTSPAAVAGDLVAVANADRHIYAVSRVNGTQKWKIALDNLSTQPLAIQDETVYVIDETGIVYAVEQDGRRWATSTQMEPTAGVVVGEGRVIVVGRAGDDKRLVLLNREDGEIIDTFTQTGDNFMLPAIGDQLIYVVGSKVWALDLYHEREEEDATLWQELWSFGAEDSARFSSPPVYVSPGPTSLAELYVSAADGRIYLLDANTGKRLEWYSGDQEAISLTVNNRRLYAAGYGDTTAGLLSAYDRETRDFLWEKGLTSLPVGGPITDGENVFVFLEDGTVSSFDGIDGSEIEREFIPSTLRGGAVSGRYIFSVGANNKIYALEGSN